MVKSAIEDLGLSVAEAATALGVTRAQVHRVVNGTSKVTPQMALRLEVGIGSTADARLRLQAAYDAAQIRERASEITNGLKRIPVPA